MLAAGNSYEVACAAAGIDYATFRRWMVRGKAQTEGKFREFCEVITRAEAQAEAQAVAIIRKAGETDWRAAMWWLERRHSERWSPHSRLSVTQRTTGQLTAQHASAPDVSALQRVLMASARHVEKC